VTANTKTVAGYSHVAIMVDDLDAAMTFYCDVLGFEVLPRPDFGPGAWLQAGSAQVHIGVVDEMPDNGKGFPHFALLVPADAYDSTMAALADRGIPFLMGPNAREDFGRPVRAAFIQDPAANVIELTDVDPVRTT
jgi:catechol 2,3-dioxygenase-like lactoylglutathione lyase family enzyme